MKKSLYNWTKKTKVGNFCVYLVQIKLIILLFLGKKFTKWSISWNLEKKKKKRIKGGNLLCFSSANSTNYANFLGKNIICHKIEIKKTLYNPTKRKKGEKEGKRRNFFIILSNANSTNYFANVMGENKTHQIFHVTKLKKQKKMKKNACSWFSIRNNGPWAMWGCFWFFFFSSWGCLGGGGGGVFFF